MRRSDLCRPGDGGGLRATHTQKGRRRGMWTEGTGGWTESFPALLGPKLGEIWEITKIRAREARPEKIGVPRGNSKKNNAKNGRAKRAPDFSGIVCTGGAAPIPTQNIA
eukprot:gene20672-biopygen10128